VQRVAPAVRKTSKLASE